MLKSIVSNAFFKSENIAGIYSVFKKSLFILFFKSLILKKFTVLTGYRNFISVYTFPLYLTYT